MIVIKNHSREECVVSTTKKAIEHFERLGRVIAESRMCEPLPPSQRDVFDRMRAIDARCGAGTKDPLGEDLASHLAYIEYREAWVTKRGHRVK